jgi:hypothetical protein
MHGSGGNGRFLIGFGDAQVVCGEPFILAGDVDAGLQLRVIDRKTLYYFHFLPFYLLQAFNECLGGLE